MRYFKVTFYLDAFKASLTDDVVYAKSYDDAIEKVQAMYTCDIDIEEVFDVFDSEFLNKKIYIEMADCELYAVSVEPIVDKSIDTTSFSQENWEDQFYHAKVEKLKYFETHELELFDFAKTIKWNELKDHAMLIVRRLKVGDQEMQTTWVQNEMYVK